MERIGLATGTEIGGYVVIGPVGQGGMGAVYRVRDGDGRTVALKLVHPHLTEGPGRARLAREVAALQKVRHPGVARVLDAELDSAEAFVVTELVDGQDLAASVAQHGPLGPDALADLAERLRDALTAVHQAGVLHRDLTPANVLVTEDGPVLIDFGIAQSAEDARVTTAGQVAGTPGYLSPEVLAGGEPTRAADWWGWAGVLAFAATGRPPFGVRPLAAVLARVRTGDVDLDDLDPALAGVLLGGLAVDPARRVDPAELVAGLRALGSGAAAGAAGASAVADEVRTTVVSPPPPPVTVPPPPTLVLPAEPRTMPATAVMAVEPAAVAPAVGGQDARATTVVDPDELAGTGAERDEDGDGDWEDVDDGDWDEQDEDGDWDEDEDEEDRPGDGWDPAAAAGGPPSPPLPEPHLRVGSVLALGVLLTVGAAAWPGISLAVAVVLAVLVRSVGLDVLALHARRARKGQRRGEAARAVAGWPWYLLRAVLGVLPAALVAASAVLVVGGVGWWAIGTGRLEIAPLGPGEVSADLPGVQPWVERALLVVAVLVGLLLVWFGPMARTTRVGARFALAALAPPRAGAVALVLLALAGAGVLATLVVLGQEVVWWPLPGPPDLR